MIKEKYLSAEEIDYEVTWLINDLNLSGIRMRKWNGELHKSALIVADLQNYFLLPDSHAFIPSAPAILENIRILVEFFRSANRPVIFTKHTNTLENAENMALWWRDLIDPESMMADLYGGYYSSGDLILEKHQYDAFYNTNLEQFLIIHSVTHPVICGVMTNLCCETTVRSAFIKGFVPVLPIDATAAYNRDFHLSTFRNLCFGFSPMHTTSDIISTLK